MPVASLSRLRIVVVFAIPLLIVCLFWLASNPRVVPGKAQEAKNRFPDVHFTDVTEKAGIHFQHVNGATGRKLLPYRRTQAIEFRSQPDFGGHVGESSVGVVAIECGRG